jgi:septum formation inhibitor MinC
VNIQTEAEEGGIKFPVKKYSEDTQQVKDFLMKELTCNNKLIQDGDGDSSSGSDDAPSEDNLNIDDICLLIPAVDKKLKNALKKANMKNSMLQKTQEENLKNAKNQEKAKKMEESEQKTKPVKRKQAPPTAKPDPAKKKRVVEMVDKSTQTDNSDIAL